MRKTISQKILTLIAKAEEKNPKATFNKTMATKKFRKVENIDNSVMRRARELAENKMLKRVSAGEYKLTAKGRRSVN